MARSRVELFEQIRKDRRVEDASIRELAGRHHVHRRTVRQALDSAVPPPRKAYPSRPRPAIDPYVRVIDGWLVAGKDVPRKQRHTARRVWQRLVAEHGATVSEVTVSRHVARRRTELGLDRVDVAVPQEHLPGAEAEADFGEFHAVIAGTLLKLWMFVLRLSYPGRAFHAAFATQAQEAFLEGHVLAFEHFGAVPGRIRYDNLKPAGVRVLKGRDRAEPERFVALRSHYLFDSFFCIPGPEGAHEKGGVEGEIGRFRRRHLVPVPSVTSLAALNQRIAAADIVDDGRVITGRPAVALGDPGTGKTHLLIGLGLAACEQSRRVRYATTAALVNELAEAAGQRQLSRVVARYGRLDLLLLDELGYVQLDSRGAELLFQIITEREERASIAIGTNLPFSEWGTVFPDPRLVAAIVNRVTFNAHILETGTHSYRLAASKTASPSHARCPAPAAASSTAAGPASKRPTGNAADAPPEPPAPSAAASSTPRPQTAENPRGQNSRGGFQ